MKGVRDPDLFSVNVDVSWQILHPQAPALIRIFSSAPRGVVCILSEAGFGSCKP